MDKNYVKRAISFSKSNPILMAAVVLAIISSLFLRPKLSYINYKVLIILFVLMLVFSGFNRIKFLDYISVTLIKKCKSSRVLELTLIFLTFFMAMIVTNDVAVIIMVPITIAIAKKVKFNVISVIILQDIGANLGSFFTPMGNPRNLFLFSHYNLSVVDFMKVTAPYLIVSIIFLLVIILAQKNEVIKVNLKDIKVESKKEGLVLLGVLIYDLLCVFNVVSDISALVVTVVVVFIFDKKAFAGVGYKLLITFVGFFIFVGNIGSIQAVRHVLESLLHGNYSTFFITMISEQIISGVPTVMMLANFTSHYKELILAINIGSMGTLISTMANLISYKSYAESFGDAKKYFKKFTIYNLLGIAIFTVIYLISTII